MATEVDQTGDIYKQIEDYDWDNDAEFQTGLRSITGSASSPAQIEHLTLRARCFYFSRKLGTKIDFEGYQWWRAQQGSTNANGITTNGQLSNQPETSGEVPQQSDVHAAAVSPHGNAPTPASFAEICQLIAEGKPIPGIKEIPDTILEGQATESVATKRRKPWEKEDLGTTEPTAANQ